MRKLLDIWFAVRSMLATLGRIERKVDWIMGIVEDVDTVVQAIEDGVAALGEAETEVKDAVDALAGRIPPAGTVLTDQQVAELNGDLDRLRTAADKVSTVKTDLGGVKDSLDAIDPSEQPAPSPTNQASASSPAVDGGAAPVGTNFAPEGSI